MERDRNGVRNEEKRISHAVGFPLELTVAVLCGTGPQGRGPARRFAAAGLTVVIGSRSADRPGHRASATGGATTGAHDPSAAEQGDVVLVVVPWDDGYAEPLRELAPALAG